MTRGDGEQVNTIKKGSAPGLAKVRAVGGWEGLAAAVVIMARHDAARGDTAAADWLHHVAPVVLAWVFVDLDPAYLQRRLSPAA